MTTHTTHAPTDGTPAPDLARVQAFAGQMFASLSAAATALMLSVGHRTGLFDAMAGTGPATSVRIAASAGLQERYVREWLGAMTTAGIVEYDPTGPTYHLPVEHAALLTRDAGADNLASQMQFIPLLAQVEDQVVRCFAEGGGVPYAAYERFHDVMAEQSAQTNDEALVDRIVPMVPGLDQRLSAGARVADLGCGQGHAVNLLARAYPASEFVGYDISARALDVARSEAASWGLSNAGFEVRDVADLSACGGFDLVTAFDAIHDQARPAAVLAEIAAHLNQDGTFLMVDMFASSRLEENLDIPWAPFLYTVSTMHCMTVSLSLDGAGLGTAWGVELAQQMLADAGFGDVRLERLEQDFINGYFVARR